MPVGAASRPQRPVKTTSVITRGFVSATKSRQSAVMARLCSSTWVVIAFTLPSPQPESGGDGDRVPRSDEHTSELQSLMRISYAVFCLKKKKKNKTLRLK